MFEPFPNFQTKFFDFEHIYFKLTLVFIMVIRIVAYVFRINFRCKKIIESMSCNGITLKCDFSHCK